MRTNNKLLKFTMSMAAAPGAAGHSRHKEHAPNGKRNIVLSLDDRENAFADEPRDAAECGYRV